MTAHLATYVRGRWRVPVGSIVGEDVKPCDNCGHDITVLTIRTAVGEQRIENDINDYVDAESPDEADHVYICDRCRDTLMGGDD
jgi:deoxycytidylate deaminase